MTNGESTFKSSGFGQTDSNTMDQWEHWVNLGQRLVWSHGQRRFMPSRTTLMVNLYSMCQSVWILHVWMKCSNHLQFVLGILNFVVLPCFDGPGTSLLFADELRIVLEWDLHGSSCGCWTNLDLIGQCFWAVSGASAHCQVLPSGSKIWCQIW